MIGGETLVNNVGQWIPCRYIEEYDAFDKEKWCISENAAKFEAVNEIDSMIYDLGPLSNWDYKC